MNYSDIIITPMENHRYRTVTDITYKDIRVPAGYETDGASIPRILWWFIPPNESTIMPAVIVHDYMCHIKQYHKGDRYFKEILNLLNISKFKIWYLVTGVTLYTRFIR